MRKREGVEPRNNFVTHDQGLHLLEVSTCISEMRSVFQVLALPKLKG